MFPGFEKMLKSKSSREIWTKILPKFTFQVEYDQGQGSTFQVYFRVQDLTILKNRVCFRFESEKKTKARQVFGFG